MPLLWQTSTFTENGKKRREEMAPNKNSHDSNFAEEEAEDGEKFFVFRAEKRKHLWAYFHSLVMLDFSFMCLLAKVNCHKERKFPG